MSMTNCHTEKVESCLIHINSKSSTSGLTNSKPPKKARTKLKGQIPHETEVNLPSHQLEDKRVTFEDHVEIKFTRTRQEISAQEHRKKWYSRQEYDNITRVCLEQINILNSGSLLKDRKHCVRGLESCTRLKALSKQITRCLAYDAVFGEQERQRRAGNHKYDTDEIARVYNSASNGCQLWAHAVGLADHRHADKIHDECTECVFA